MICENTPGFERDFKKLLKKFKTPEDDFEVLKEVHIKTFHDPRMKGLGIQMQDPVLIKGFCRKEAEAYKVRKFACKALKGKGSNTGLRVIYVRQSNIDKITFVEIYFKADQESENRDKLKEFLANI
jgi:hypothetical protein